MGRKNKKYSIPLKKQAYLKLKDMQAFGESKKIAKENDLTKDKIFSFSTYETYLKHIKYFIDYLNDCHPKITTLKQAKKFVNEWLQYRCDYVNEKGEHLSAWTLHTEAKALSKLFGISPTDKDYFKPPKRERVKIKRSRIDVERDKHFSTTNNAEFIKFCQGTGLRKKEVRRLRGKDLFTMKEIEEKIKFYEKKQKLENNEISYLRILKDCHYFNEDYFLFINGKGGRKRFAPIIGENKEQIINRIKSTAPNDKVWLHVNSNADIHSYRSDYATTIYKFYARKIKDIPYDKINKGSGHKYQSDVYVCRKDEKGKKLDRKAMEICSKALGHNRISIIADNYLRGV